MANSAATPVPVAGTVKVNNGADSPVPIAGTVTVASSRVPRSVTLYAQFQDGYGYAYDTLNVVSADKWFVVESAWVLGRIPIGQVFRRCFVQTIDESDAQAFLLPNIKIPRPDEELAEWVLNSVPCRVYVPPGEPLTLGGSRTQDSGYAQLSVTMTGYMTDTP